MCLSCPRPPLLSVLLFNYSHVWLCVSSCLVRPSSICIFALQLLETNCYERLGIKTVAVTNLPPPPPPPPPTPHWDDDPNFISLRLQPFNFSCLLRTTWNQISWRRLGVRLNFSIHLRIIDIGDSFGFFFLLFIFVFVLFSFWMIDSIGFSFDFIGLHRVWFDSIWFW